MAVSVTTVTQGTAVTVFAAFTKPTRATYPNVTQVATDPTTIEVVWQWAGGAKKTWTYGTGAHITKLSTGVYVFTIPTQTQTSNMITGVVSGAGVVTATGKFTITVDPL